MSEYTKDHQPDGVYYSREEIYALAEQFGIDPVRFGKRIGPRDTLFFLELAVLVELTLRQEVAELQALGEHFPIIFYVDGVSKVAKMLKQLLPSLPERCPHDPGVWTAYPNKEGRDYLQRVFRKGYLLDDTRGADPASSFWDVRVFGNSLTIRLITPTEGKEQVLRDLRFPIQD